ncbi:hypothetical protein BH93_03160 [Rhodococcoides fascians A25f]|uniref:hypothetical protein n=1 Tax=Rhodococcoides fascians TaxID=1828 RepID=UPI00055A52C7|nr:hypothetical protein [Rhodococcus fascians]QII04497.1 hypothetical protein BH93_03160 [Rhodococcus fascians A25f]
MVMTVLMAFGAVGAVLPLLGRSNHTGRVRWAHLCMAIVMAAMVAFGMDSTIAMLASLALIVAALYVTTGISRPSPSGPCVVDLTCMAVLLLLMPSVHTHSTAEPAPAAPMHRHGPGLDPGLVVVALLAVWIGSTLYMFHRSHSGRRAAAGSLLMIIGMAPVAI